MGKWDENSGYYCLLIAIFCGLDVYESVLMYKYGPNHPLCQKILTRHVTGSNSRECKKSPFYSAQNNRDTKKTGSKDGRGLADTGAVKYL